jgi:isochorismate synthase
VSERSAAAPSLGEAFDLAAAYADPEHDFLLTRSGLGVAGQGVDERLVAADPAGVLARLRSRAPGALAVGALPFTEPGEGTLAIPRVAVRREAPGVPTVAGDPERLVVLRALGRASPHDAFLEVQLRSIPEPEAYAGAVLAARELIAAGELRKVVLARTIEVEAGRVLDARRLALHLRAVDPGAFVFAAPVEGGAIVGASPELLVSRHGATVRAAPLAGSAPRSGDPERDRANARALLDSAKDREEHAIVVEAVEAALAARCEHLERDPEPVLHATANVWHLATRFEGVLAGDPEVPDALTLALALHPTPAVGGTPTARALGAIGDLEPFDRGAYAGPVGWVDAAGDGEWAIALRCARLRGARATLFAGAGIVADSDPWGEVDETARKFGASLDSLRWG